MNKLLQFEKDYMCKKSEKTVNDLWVVCDSFCEKTWVIVRKFIFVGKSRISFTSSPTQFQQVFLTHQPLLSTNYSPVSTTPITTTNYIKEKK